MDHANPKPRCLRSVRKEGRKEVRRTLDTPIDLTCLKVNGSGTRVLDFTQASIYLNRHGAYRLQIQIPTLHLGMMATFFFRKATDN